MTKFARNANGQFVKGNPGRPRAATNKATGAIREAAHALVEDPKIPGEAQDRPPTANTRTSRRAGRQLTVPQINFDQLPSLDQPALPDVQVKDEGPSTLP